jgi:mycothiol synthase
MYCGHTMIGFSVLSPRTAAEPVHEMRLNGGVHPAYRGRGIGSELLGWAEQAARPLHGRRFPGRPLSLEGHCLAGNEGAVELFSAHGYAPARWFLRMSCELIPHLPAAQVPAGIQVVGFTPGRSDDARLVRDDAFRDHWGSTKNTDETWAHFVGPTAWSVRRSTLMPTHRPGRSACISGPASYCRTPGSRRSSG